MRKLLVWQNTATLPTNRGPPLLVIRRQFFNALIHPVKFAEYPSRSYPVHSRRVFRTWVGHEATSRAPLMSECRTLLGRGVGFHHLLSASVPQKSMYKDVFFQCVRFALFTCVTPWYRGIHARSLGSSSVKYVMRKKESRLELVIPSIHRPRHARAMYLPYSIDFCCLGFVFGRWKPGKIR